MMIKQNLSGIPETLLIPLAIRASESEKREAIVRDFKAREIVSQIDYDFDKFKSAKLSHLGVCIRTMLLDNALLKFVNEHDDCLVINLGAGLDTRRERLHLDKTIWYDLDVPEAIELRRNFFQASENYNLIPKSMFDFSWFDEIQDEGRPVMIIAEGLFMYFEEDRLKPLMRKLTERFSKANMLLEVMGPLIVGKSKHHDSLSKMEDAPEFKWGIKDSNELTMWAPGIKILDEWCYFDFYKEHAGIIGYIVRLPFIRPYIAPRIVSLSLA